MRQSRSEGHPLFAALIIFCLIGWYIYNHYIRDIRKSMGPAYKIATARRDIYRFMDNSKRLLLAVPARLYQQKASAIDHDLFIAAHPPPSNLKAMWVVKYGKARMEGWFIVLFLSQIAPLAAAILFIRIMIASFLKKPSTNDDYSGLLLENRAYANSLSLRRASCHHLELYGLVKGMNSLSKTAKTILGILAGYEEWPASIGGHMAARGGLIDHTGAVLQGAVEVLKGRKDDLPLNIVVVSALAHDLGKIVAYEKCGDTWISRGIYHDGLSAAILSSLPEFHREYRGIEKESLLLAVMHHHSPLDLRLNAPPLAKKLLKVLQKADSIAVRREGEDKAPKRDISPQLQKSLSQALPVLNINRWQGGNADGWLWGSMVFVLEHALRERIYRYLDEEIRGWFPTSRKDGQVHPLWPVLSDYLARKGLLVNEINGIKSNNGFFDLKVDGTVFQMVVALDSAGLEMPEEWNLGQAVKIEILGGQND